MAPQTTKKILITGSSGYVGQHLIARLIRHGIVSSPHKHELYCAYNSLPTFEADLDELCQSTGLHSSILKVKAFALDFQSDIVSAVKNVSGDGGLDAIIHLAALSSPFYCQGHPEEAWAINVPIGLLQLDAPIVYMSTDQVYQGVKQYYDEGDDTHPVNLYGRTKLAFERVLNGEIDPLLSQEELGDSTIPDNLSSSNLRSLKPHTSSVILRSSLILGGPTPFTHGCKKGSFPSFLQFVESRLKSSTATDYFINEYRSMVHIEDVLRSLLHFTQLAIMSLNTQSTVRTYNLGGSERVNRYDLAMKMASHLKLDESCVNGVERAGGGCVPSPPDISMNVENLTEELGVEKLDGLDEIVKSTFQ